MAMESFSAENEHPVKAILVCMGVHPKHADAGVGLSRSDDGQITAHVDQ